MTYFLKLMAVIAVFGLPAQADMQLVLLGTGTPNPEPQRAGAATAVIVDGTVWIVDAGPGVVRRVEAARRKGAAALTQPSLSRALITHLHSDHTLGLPDLIYSPWTLERTNPISLWGPKGLKDMVLHLEKAYAADMHNRLTGAEPANDTGWQTMVKEIGPGIVYKDDRLTIEAIAACHGDWEQAFAYKFSHEGNHIVISGDTTYCPAIEKAAAGADILLHEVYDAAALAKRAADWRAYNAAAHTSGPDLGKLAAKAGVKHLVLYHQLVWSGSKEAVIGQIRMSYTGPLTWGQDLMILPVK